MKKAMGRPRIGTNRAKSVFISAQFTPVEAKQIHAAIAKTGLSKSDFVRKSLLISAGAISV